MKVYLASSFTRRAEMEEFARDLRGAGIEVVSRWHDRRIRDVDVDAESGRAGAFAVEDMTRIGLADVFLLDTTERSSHGGYDTEFGVAAVLRKRLMVAGLRRNVFHCLPDVEEYVTLHDAFLALIAELPVRQVALPTSTQRKESDETSNHRNASNGGAKGVR